MLLCNWFDVDNLDHLAAWQHMLDQGQWPAGFIPQGVTIENYWETLIRSKLADAWVSDKLGRPRMWTPYPENIGGTNMLGVQ